jgi:SPP1 gp7 family putative phage head morphogenesis protein
MPTKSQKALRKDPTRTLTIRRAFEAELVRRFNKLKRAVTEVLSDPDVFGPRLATNRGRFEFTRSDQKADAFMGWLRDQEQSGAIRLIERSSTGSPGALDQRWANLYVDSAYQAGIRRARAEMRAAGRDVPPDVGPGAAFNQPFHADRVGMIYSRVYTDLAGITSAMDQQISRVLAQGIVDGRNPMDIARDINGRIDAIGIARARTLARTEVIRAHHSANVAEYRAAGVLGVDVLAEWVTAGDDLVCPECESLAADGPYTIDDIEGMIPAHPNCRCVAVPMLVD